MEKSKKTKFLLTFLCGCIAMLWALNAQAVVYEAYTDASLYGDLVQSDVDVPSMACGPTAVTNSLVYLQKMYPEVYGTSLVPSQGSDLNLNGTVDFYDDMIAVANTLTGSSYMDTTLAEGTYWYRLLYGKEKYIEEVAPGLTSYSAQRYPTWSAYTLEPSWSSAEYTTWEFLYDNLTDGEDVEVLFSTVDEWGHYLTVTKFYWDDANEDGALNWFDTDEDDKMELADDWEAYLELVDPLTGSINTAFIADDVVDGLTFAYNFPVFGENYGWLSLAVSESPGVPSVPEPATMLLLGTGLLGLALSGRRIRRA